MIMGLIPTSVDIELGVDSLMIVCFKAKCSIYIRFMITFIKVSYLLNVCLYLLFVCLWQTDWLIARGESGRASVSVVVVVFWGVGVGNFCALRLLWELTWNLIFLGVRPYVECTLPFSIYFRVCLGAMEGTTAICID